MDEIVAKLEPAILEEAALLEEHARIKKRDAVISERISEVRGVIYPACDALHTLGIVNPENAAIRDRCWKRRRQVDEHERFRRMEAIAP